MTRAISEWDYAGTNLSKYAYNVMALGAPEQVPEKRNDNLVVPHRTGRTHVEKFYDQRTLALSMYVRGTPTDGGQASGSQLWTNLEKLKALFALPGRQTLKCKNATGATREASVEIIRPVMFMPEGPDHYKFVVEFTFPDVWWQSQSLSTIGPTTIAASPHEITVLNEGTQVAEKPVITFEGPFTNPKLWVTYRGISVWVAYGGVLASGETCILTTGRFEALVGGVDKSGLVVHDGHMLWLPIPVGTNTVTCTSDGYGTGPSYGKVTISFYQQFI